VADPGRSPGEPDDQPERLLRPRPKLADQTLAAGAEEAAEDDSDDDRIVELPRDRDEVGHEVERQREVTGKGEQEQLAPAGTRGSRASRVTRTMQSGMNVANARASPRRPTRTSTSTNAA
jgi:hypothetical protein